MAYRNNTNIPGRVLRLAFASLVAASAVALVACGDDATEPVDLRSLVRPAEAAGSPTLDASPAPALPAADNQALERARQLLREGRFEASADAFKAVASAATPGALRAEANLGEAVSKFEAGDRNGSLESLRKAVGEAPKASVTWRRAGYLLGVRLNENGDHRGAVDALRPVAESDASDALQPYIIAEYGRAQGHAGDGEGAGRTWNLLLARTELPNSVKATAYTELADLAKAAHNVDDEQYWLQLLVGTAGTPDARYRLAKVAQQRYDADTFVTQLRAITDRAPASQLAAIAIADLRDAGYEVDPGQEGFIYYRRGAIVEAQRVLEGATAQGGGTKSASDLAFETFYLAAAYEDGGRLEDARAAYDRVAGIDPGSQYAHRAKYWAARVTEALEDPLGASKRYAELVLEGPEGEFTAESAFRAGYTLLEAGDPARALGTWGVLPVVKDARLSYWMGRAQENAGDRAGAEASFAAAIEANSLDFYGQEAARKLGRQGPVDVSYKPLAPDEATDWTALEAWLREKVPGGALDTTPTAADDLLDLGLRDAAEKELMAAAEGGDVWKLASVIREAESLGLADITAQLAVRLRQQVGVSSDEAPRELLRLAYPLAYHDLLDDAGRANGLDPLFVAALVRQESFWDAEAGSHAGALGLTQVIPPTGEAIAVDLGYKDFRPEDLFRPSVSLSFGAHYLGGQVRRFENPYYALAAYNAGPGPIERWKSRAQGESPADFVEAVEYSETKHYVVLVMEHYAHYTRAWR